MNSTSMAQRKTMSGPLIVLTVFHCISLTWASVAMAGDFCAGQPDGTLCDDGDACTQIEECLGGECGGGIPVNGSDGNVCTDDSCDSKVGVINVCVPDGTACDSTPYGGGPGYCLNCMCAEGAIPTVSEWGVAVMAVLIFTAGVFIARRRTTLEAC